MTPARPRSTAFGRALQNVAWLLTGKGVGAVLSLVYLALATRSLGVERFGQFALILSAGQAMAALVGFQTWQIVVRFGMTPLQGGADGRLARLVGFCAALDVGAAVTGCVLAVAGIWAIGPSLGWHPALVREATVFAFVLLLSVRSTAVGVLRLHDRYALGAAADAVTPIVRFLGAVAAVLAGPSVSRFLLAWGAAEVLTSIVYWTLARRVAPGAVSLRRWRGWTRAPREHAGLWHFGLVTNLNSTLNAASKQLMVILVGLVAGQAAAGGYRLASQLSQALARVSDMFSRGIFPEFTRAHAAETRDELRRLLRQSTRLAVLFGATIAVLLPLIGKPALGLVAGRAYLDAYPLLLLLGFAAALDVMGVGFEPVLFGTGRQSTAFRIRLAVVAMLLAAAALLMPAYGAVGAGWATLAASTLGLALFARAAWRGTR